MCVPSTGRPEIVEIYKDMAEEEEEEEEEEKKREKLTEEKEVENVEVV